MICMFLTFIFTILGGMLLGFLIAAPATIPVVFSFFCSQIPLAKFATIETFIEIGLLVYLILTKIFRRNNAIKVIGLIVMIFLTITAFYISFRFKIVWSNDIPVLGDFYMNIYHFFSGIIDKVSAFFR